MTDAPGLTILQGGRRKAYRPLEEVARRTALEQGLAAYERGDFFEAHELLEPAWMGTADLAERELYQGLIKLAAAFVHEVRGNRAGVAKNLAGARARLAAALDGSSAASGAPDVAQVADLDVVALIADVDRIIAVLADPAARIEPPVLRRTAR